ncbi:Phospholipase D alpha 1 [Gracilariopsis chorda]|uniref:phospholipase D n=1 Tax=Gracilariopsis chorda TaxID=448386 RepID=A0A2V3IPF3_9FLOR|nr:Phospholipase D alpha 1 [Gracilariopsis chorda]|eukprot:PXF43966.1 Phospholipase D alpha 1 [Gracilariopsis chorda]
MEERAYSGNPSETQPAIGAFLHGKLSVSVHEARNVEGTGTSRFFERLERAVTSSIDGVDPYVSVKLGYNKIMQTRVIDNTSSPQWNSTIVFDVCHDFSALEFRVKAAKRTGPLSILSKVKHLSMLSITAARISEERSISDWFPLGPYVREVLEEEVGGDHSDEDDAPDSPPDVSESAFFGDLRITVIYTPVSELDDYASVAMQELYFPLREGVRVRFYQDADSVPGYLPVIPFRPEYHHGRCWSELARAIMSSTELIYITGWAVWPELVMVRTNYDEDEWNGLTLGNMLKQKAEEGVTVCVMVWDEYASNQLYQGMMGTHDEEIVAYFDNSRVNCIKVGRQNPKYGPLADLNDAIMFTHHQKTVLVTRHDPHSGKSRLEAWIGGLDLTDGRYDNQNHSLFRTLKDLHAPPDFWQACALTVTSDSGPREPWHDIHAHVTGMAAWDILTNFEGRWARQAPDHMKNSLHQRSEETLMLASEENEKQDGDFNCHLLRSINEASTKLSLERPGLMVRRNAHSDCSIHHAYVHQIRAAKHFIYIENQYFLGSSHLWDSNQRGGFASHLVPIEIAEKICAKIRSGERFAVYVSVPMYPEGPPDSAAVQEILSHQRKTINLITSRVKKTIDEVGSDTSVSDWFNLFCLVNRESEEGGEGNGGGNDVEKRLSESRRFMIYLHSKFAVFDDTVAVVGSANINSRSLDGSRDTEIAIAAWQPEHVATGSNGYLPTDGEPSLPQGDVAAFRASVWSEHLGGYHDVFENPSSLECVHHIRELATTNWETFKSDDPECVTDLPYGHLVLFPYEYDETTGEVIATDATFPDFSAALIKGKATPALPNTLTG